MQTGHVIQIYVASARELRPEDFVLLTDEERSRASRFHFEKDRRLFVLARCVLRSMLGKALHLPASEVRLRAGPNGKPELDTGNHSLSFNLSHSGNQVAVAIAPGPTRLGVDIELHNPGVEIHSIARNYFCPREIELLRGSPEQARSHFFRFWTLKEAYLKAVGIGLGLKLSTIDVSQLPLQSAAPPEYPDGREPHGIRVQSLPAPDGYSAAVAADGPEWQAEVIPWIWNA